MKKMFIVLLIPVLFLTILFTSQKANATTIISNENDYFKIEIVDSMTYQFLYGSDTQFFNSFKVSTSNVVYVNGVLWAFNYYQVNLSNSTITYLDQSISPYDGILFKSNMTYEVRNDFIQVGDIIEIYDYVYSYDLTIQTNYLFDTGYLQYSFHGTYYPASYYNFPKFPSDDVSARYNFIEMMNTYINYYNVNKFVLYLPKRVTSSINDTTYQVMYYLYSYNAFTPNDEPVLLSDNIISIEFVSSYSILNQAPYFKVYFKGLYGDVIDVFPNDGTEYLYISLSTDFVLNIGYNQFTDDYYNGYSDGRSDGILQGILDGFADGYAQGRNDYGLFFNNAWRSASYMFEQGQLSASDFTVNLIELLGFFFAGIWGMVLTVALAPISTFGFTLMDLILSFGSIYLLLAYIKMLLGK